MELELPLEIESEIRSMLKKGISIYKIALKYGIDKNQVKQIRRGMK